MNNTRNRVQSQDTEQITSIAARPCALFRVAALRENRRNRDVGDAARGAGNSVFQMGSLPIRKTDTIPRGYCTNLSNVFTEIAQSLDKVCAMPAICSNFDETLFKVCAIFDKALHELRLNFAQALLKL